jgi:hypothetical protein
VVAHAELLPEQHRHALAGPDLALEAVLGGAAPQELGDAGALGVAQAWRCSRRWSMPQPGYSFGPHACAPLADGALCDTQRLGDPPLRPALFLELPGAQAAPLPPIMRLT